MIHTHTHTHTHSHTHDGILLSHIKEGNFAICNNMDGLAEYYAKWNKSGRERQIQYAITYMWDPKNKPVNTEKKKQTNRYRKQISFLVLWGTNY